MRDIVRVAICIIVVAALAAIHATIYGNYA